MPTGKESNVPAMGGMKGCFKLFLKDVVNNGARCALHM